MKHGLNMKNFKHRVLCPRLEDGRVYRISISSPSESVLVCEECEMVWADNGSEISAENFLDYTLSGYCDKTGRHYPKDIVGDQNYEWWKGPST